MPECKVQAVVLCRTGIVQFGRTKNRPGGSGRPQGSNAPPGHLSGSARSNQNISEFHLSADAACGAAPADSAGRPTPFASISELPSAIQHVFPPPPQLAVLTGPTPTCRVPPTGQKPGGFYSSPSRGGRAHAGSEHAATSAVQSPPQRILNQCHPDLGLNRLVPLHGPTDWRAARSRPLTRQGSWPR